MKKKLLLLLAAILATIPSLRAWTVYFTNPDNWQSVNVYAWNSSGTKVTSNAYPGDAMSFDDNIGLWTYTGSGTPSKLLFNFNGDSNKTNDLTYSTNGVYDKSGTKSVSNKTVYLAGSFNEWDANNNSQKSSATGVVKFTNQEIGTGDFKIVYDNKWCGSSGSSISAGSWQQFIYDGGNNTKISNAKAGERFDVTYNVASNKIKIVSLGVPDPVFYLKGGMNGWSTVNEWKFSKDNGYKLNGVRIAAGVEFVVNNGTGDFSNNSNSTYSIPNKATSVAVSTTAAYEKNIKFANDFYGDIELTYNGTTPSTLKLTWKEDLPSNIYMSMNVNGRWQHGISLSKDGNVFSGEFNAEAAENYVCFFKTQISDWPANNDFSNRYGCDNTNNSNVTVTSGVPVNFKLNAGGVWVMPSTGVYKVEFNLNTNQVTFTKLRDLDFGDVNQDFNYTVRGDGYVYFNAGAEYYTRTDQWGNTEENSSPENSVLKARFFNGSTQISEDKMTFMPEEETPMYKAKIPADADGVDFILYKADGSTWVRDFKTTGGDTNRDAANWDKFIYGLGSYAYQSYLTYSQYRKLLDNKGENGLFFIGSHIGKAEWDRTDLLPAVKDEGVYIQELDFGNSSDAKQFKISFIDPEAVNASSPYNLNRWWATFNLGIVGPKRHYYTKENGAVKEHLFEYDTSGSNNDDIVYIEGLTSQYNHYNQFNWQVRKSQNKMWFVIDTKYETAVLLDFNPQPKLSDLKVNDIETFNLSTNLTGDVTGMQGVQFNGGNEANGIAMYQTVNYVDGSATLTPAAITDLDDFIKTHTVEYNLLYNSQELGSFEGSTGEEKTITISTMVGGQAENVSIRATYTDSQYLDKNGKPLKYRSRTARDENSNNFELEGVAVGSIEYAKLHNYGTAENAFDAVVRVPITMPVTAYAVYPSVEAKAGDANAKSDVYVAGSVANANHAYAKKDVYFMKDHTAHTPWNGTDPYDDAKHNWASAAAKSGIFPLDFNSVLQNQELTDVEVAGTVYACYPFLIKKQGNFTVNEKKNVAPRRAVQLTSKNPADYHIVAVMVGTPVSTTIQPYNGGLSGIEEAAVAGEGSYELYNLQGVRVVDANPAPGIYIRRAADGTASKVYIK